MNILITSMLLLFSITVSAQFTLNKPLVQRSNANIVSVDEYSKANRMSYLPALSDSTLNGGPDLLGAIFYAAIPGKDTGIFYRTILPNGQRVFRKLGGGNVTGIAGVAGFNGRTGNVTLVSSDITGTLGFTPVNPNGTAQQYIRGDGQKTVFPNIPAQVNLIQGSGIILSGTYPDITITSSGGGGGAIATDDYEATATGGQTTFTPDFTLPSDPTRITVWRNGVEIGVIRSGNNIVISACQAGAKFKLRAIL